MDDGLPILMMEGTLIYLDEARGPKVSSAERGESATVWSITKGINQMGTGKVRLYGV